MDVIQHQLLQQLNLLRKERLSIVEERMTFSEQTGDETGELNTVIADAMNLLEIVFVLINIPEEALMNGFVPYSMDRK